MSKRFIGGAWPYANGDLHLGHIAGLIGGDILARYFRLKGDEVIYVSGSDCHGTPISIRAEQEGVTPRDITDRYHNEFRDCFNKLGFSYDLYTRTDDENHHKVVKELFLELYKRGIIYGKETEQIYCESCNRFLPDRFVEGICPHCGEIARGDQCDFCSSLLDPSDLKERKCKICGAEPKFRATKHLYLDLPRYEKRLSKYISTSKHWRENAINLSKRYIREGLVERAATRDLTWGIDVPIDGYNDKKIYVWVDAVLGYISATKALCEEKGLDWTEFWKDDVKSYFVHGKDNIPFHSIILPALLLGLDLHLPDYMVSSEYLTLEGSKISTSRNYAVWARYIVDNYNADSIRYFLIANGPEKRDGDFSWREFINSHNGELLGVYGNFVNRTLAFINRFLKGKVPNGNIDSKVEEIIKATYENSGKIIERFEFKEALDNVFALIRFGNKYFDEKAPWIDYKEDIEKCEETIYNCVQIIGNLAILLEPFVPFSAEKIRDMLQIESREWRALDIKPDTKLKDVKVLFERIDKEKINEEVQALKKSIQK